MNDNTFVVLWRGLAAHVLATEAGCTHREAYDAIARNTPVSEPITDSTVQRVLEAASEDLRGLR